MPEGRAAVDEAPLEATEHGLVPAGAGWFVVNARAARWRRFGERAADCLFEGTGEARFPQLGINLNVLQPGQPLAMYHWEADQEDFLVLAGEARLLVNGEERPLQAWDFVHSPAGTEHVIVGAGDGPAIMLAAGRRPDEEQLMYPRSELAEKYGASAEADTPNPREAYARFDRPQPGRPDYWDELPWA